MKSPSFGRLESQIKQKVAIIIQRDLKDPRLGFLTVTRVELSRDKQHCRVYYSVLGEKGERSKAAHALDDARGHIQSALGRTLETRNIPHLKFEYDESIEGSIRVSGILDQLAKERGEDEEQPTEGTEDTEATEATDSDEEE
ncbi:MAG: 30S ribosome-binding factor RbfA [Planctomycetota bacterium]